MICQQTIRTIAFICFFGLLLFVCNAGKDSSDKNRSAKSVPLLDYEYIKSYPHDTTSYTEGLLIYGGKLYESTGATRKLPQTRSLFGSVDLRTGKLSVKVELDREKYFGEGITFLKGKVYQLTYKTKLGFVYDAKNFGRIGEFTFPSEEGWGLTTNGTNLIMSDGTNRLTFLDPDTLRVVRIIFVSENGRMRDHLNELEHINGYIYANVWPTNTIVKIDPVNGRVVGKLDLTALAKDSKERYSDAGEMNGIAYDSVRDRVYITGKLWPKIYEIKISH